MKKAVAFLLALFIFVAPITTFVKADVVIGDNDNTIMNENATILGRKLAMLESLSDLALSGVTEYTISNTEDVDIYLDSLWSEINNAIDYLGSGDWVGDIPNEIASKYYTNLVNYRDVVNNRGEFLGFDLQNPTTSLLKTYFANNIYGKKYTSTGLYQSLDTFRALSRLNNSDNNVDNTPSEYQQYINIINGQGFTNFLDHYKQLPYNGNISPVYWGNDYSYFYSSRIGAYSYQSASLDWEDIICTSYIYDLYINTVNNEYQFNINISNPNDYPNNFYGDYGYSKRGFRYTTGNFTSFRGTSSYSNINVGRSYTSLSDLLGHISATVHNVNIYVDGNPWSIVGGSSKSPTLDIDGIIKLYGNDNPKQYELQPNTQIDYDQLYQVIYNAIRDNLPISQGDINYYDSHDTIYSPTIINNYGDEEGEESDLIDTILDYAVIPKFDTAIAQPMRQALTNGVLVMNTSITNVIPDEILLVLGACFFLLLFAVVINRMIKYKGVIYGFCFNW